MARALPVVSATFLGLGTGSLSYLLVTGKSEFFSSGGFEYTAPWVLIGAAGLASIGLFLSKSPAWKPSLCAWGAGLVLTLLSGWYAFTPVAVEGGQMPRIMARNMALYDFSKSERMRYQARLQDLQNGLNAGQSGHPLPAIEGGYLVPTKFDARGRMHLASVSDPGLVADSWRQGAKEYEKRFAPLTTSKNFRGNVLMIFATWTLSSLGLVAFANLSGYLGRYLHSEAV